MKLENQVSNLELSKRLRELGVKQESLWYWVDKCVEYKGFKLNINSFTPKCEKCIYISAFTVAELGEMLPTYCYTQRRKEGFIPYAYKMGFFTADGYWDLKDDTEANVRAKMLVYLIENKLKEVKR